MASSPTRAKLRTFKLISASLLALFLLSLASYAPARPALAASQSTLAQYRAWMEDARKLYPYRQSVDKMWRVMMCESTGNANAITPSGTYKGLFQYHIRTWKGSWNPYRNNSIWDAKSQIYATAKAWSIGMQSHWSCYYITSGR